MTQVVWIRFGPTKSRGSSESCSSELSLESCLIKDSQVLAICRPWAFSVGKRLLLR